MIQKDVDSVVELAKAFDSVIARKDAAIKELAFENERLRASIARSKDPCIYCSLPKDEFTKCKLGFPGCGRADDLIGCPEFGARLALDDERSKVKELVEALEKAVIDQAYLFQVFETNDEPDHAFACGVRCGASRALIAKYKEPTRTMEEIENE